MRNIFTFMVLTLSLFLASLLNGQSLSVDFPGVPLDPTHSVLFGKDIIIDNQIIQDQRDIAMCSVFNGWLFAVHSYRLGDGTVCNTSATIGFELKQNATVTITFCNVHGQALKVCTNQYFTAGKHQIILDAGQLASGTYFYTFTAGGYQSSGKVVVVH